MPSMSRYVFRPGLLLILALLAVPSAAPAQGKKDKETVKGDTVRITTVDGVELIGKFYASAAKTAPTVLILHALGEDSKKKGYQELAATLQKNYCVMTFDFRGHGESKSIDRDTFWRVPQNMSGVKGGPKSDTIEYKDFAKAYYPYLINDIAAVKGFLDRKNDLGVCNTSSFIVIGAETGATLGAIWLNSEWSLYKMEMVGMFGQLKPATRPEGKDTIAAIWLSISPTLGTRTVSLSGTLDVAARQNATPMLFFYGKEDSKGASVAKLLERAIKGTKDDSKFKYTGSVGVDSQLKGQGLVLESLGTSKAIDDYLKNVVAEKGNEWTERDFRKTMYAWRNVGLPLLHPKAFKQAKPTSENNFIFNDYSMYMK